MFSKLPKFAGFSRFFNKTSKGFSTASKQGKQSRVFAVTLTAGFTLGFGVLKNYELLPFQNKPLYAKETKKTLNVCVTGAAGQIAYSFIPMLLTGQIFGPDVSINLTLLDIPQAQEVLKGVVMEIVDCAFPLLNSVDCGSDPKKMFKDIDVGVFIGGFPRKPGMERKDLLKINGKIFKEQGEALNTVAKKDVKCVVVANPANTNCLLLQSNAPSISKKNFSALTRLDHNRSIAQIAAKTETHPTEVKNVAIWGNHSLTQYPDVNHGTVKGKPIREVVKNNDYLNLEFIAKVQKRGGEVLQARKNSSVFSAAVAVKDHLHDWYFGTKPGEHTSMAVISDGTYGVPAGLCYSYPVTTKNFDYQIVKGLKIDEFSQKKMNITTEELQQEKADAFESN